MKQCGSLSCEYCTPECLCKIGSPYPAKQFMHIWKLLKVMGSCQAMIND